MHILHTFSRVLTRRICLTIKSFLRFFFLRFFFFTDLVPGEESEVVLLVKRTSSWQKQSQWNHCRWQRLAQWHCYQCYHLLIGLELCRSSSDLRQFQSHRHMFQVLEWHLEEFVPKWQKNARCQSVFLSKLLHSQDLISNSPYLLSNISYVVSLENLVLDQVRIPLLKFLFNLITCLLDIV